MRFLVRWLINALGLLAAAFVVPGIRLGASPTNPGLNEWVTLAVVALIFALINAVIRPIVFFLTLPLTLVTLGLFTFVINALMLMLTSRIAQAFALGFRVDGFVAALLGALVISVVSFLLGRVLSVERA